MKINEVADKFWIEQRQHLIGISTMGVSEDTITVLVENEEVAKLVPDEFEGFKIKKKITSPSKILKNENTERTKEN